MTRLEKSIEKGIAIIVKSLADNIESHVVQDRLDDHALIRSMAHLRGQKEAYEVVLNLIREHGGLEPAERCVYFGSCHHQAMGDCDGFAKYRSKSICE